MSHERMECPTKHDTIDVNREYVSNRNYFYFTDNLIGVPFWYELRNVILYRKLFGIYLHDQGINMIKYIFLHFMDQYIINKKLSILWILDYYCEVN